MPAVTVRHGYYTPQRWNFGDGMGDGMAGISRTSALPAIGPGDLRALFDIRSSL